MKRVFRHIDNDSIVTLNYDKVKNLLHHNGKWIKPREFYNLGYEDANVKQICVRCKKDVKPSFKWLCKSCNTRVQKELNEIAGEVLKGV